MTAARAALATALALVAAVLVAPSGPAAAQPAVDRTVSAVDWGRCDDPVLRAFGARCALVTVPLDHRHPHGRTIKIAVSRVRHTVPASRYQGVMLTNPGGPGSAGRYLSLLGPVISEDFDRPDVGGAYDWIGIDIRGVGASRPALSCDPDYFGPNRPAYVPTTDAIYQAWQDRSRGYAAACGTAGGRLLDHMRTTDVARDLDLVRKALGATRINYYGFSYGTYLGQVYATLFPDRVRRMVLDSNVDDRNVWYRANLAQDVAFQRNLEIFFGWIAQHDATYHLGTTQGAVSQRFADVRTQLATAPVKGVVGPSEWDDIFLYAGYSDFLWPRLAGVFSGWANQGAGDDVVVAYQDFDTPGDDSSYAVYNAVSCVDDTWKDEDFLADQSATFAKAPLTTWANAWFNGPCYHWPARGRPHTTVRGAALGRALLVDETNDAATPYEGSLHLRAIARRSRLIAVVGGMNHAVTPGGNPCVDNKIFAYLKSGRLPDRRAGRQADVRCRKLPPPLPSAPQAWGAGGVPSGRDVVATLLLQAARP